MTGVVIIECYSCPWLEILQAVMYKIVRHSFLVYMLSEGSFLQKYVSLNTSDLLHCNVHEFSQVDKECKISVHSIPLLK